MSVAQIIRALRGQNAGRSARWHGLPGWLRVTAEVLVVLLLLGTYAFAGGWLWQVWSTGTFDAQAIILTLQLAVAILTMHGMLARLRPKPGGQHTDPTEAANMLRLVAAAGGDALAPPVDLPPDQAGLFISDPAVTSTLPPRGSASRYAEVIAISLLPLMGLASLGLLVWLWTLSTQPSTRLTGGTAVLMNVVLLLVAALGVALILVGVVLFRWTAREPLNPLVRADFLGLHKQTRRGRPDLTIEWSAARSYFQISDVLRSRGIGNPGLTLYALDAGDRLIAWTVDSRATPEQRAASDRLCRLIADRTRLPLRDLTQRAEDITNSRLFADLKRGTLSLQDAVAALRAPAAPLPRSLPGMGDDSGRASAPSRVRTPWWRRVLFATSTLVLLALVPGAWGLHQAQGWYYGNLVSQITSSPPLYADALTRDDGQWYTHALTNKDTEFIFAGGAYLVQSDAQGDGGEAYAPGSYGDIAVQVTLRERPTDWTQTMGDLGMAGLVARDTDGGEVRCGTNPIGDWYLMRYSAALPESDQWSVIAADQQSHTVHWGFGIPNTLLLIARGQRYWCFANGHLLGTGTDSAPLQPSHVGVFLDDNSIYATFNDFRVYAVPAGK